MHLPTHYTVKTPWREARGGVLGKQSGCKCSQLLCFSHSPLCLPLFFFSFICIHFASSFPPPPCSIISDSIYPHCSCLFPFASFCPFSFSSQPPPLPLTFQHFFYSAHFPPLTLPSPLPLLSLFIYLPLLVLFISPYPRTWSALQSNLAAGESWAKSVTTPAANK